MRSAAVLLGCIVGFSVAVASCSPPPKACDSSTCQGCCDSAGECLAGTAVFECGSGGSVCMACPANQLCRAGLCESFDGGEYDANFPGATDASINYDAGLFDAGPEIDAGRDAGPPDAGRPDSGVGDAGSTDAGRPDSGVGDAGRPDGGTGDAGTVDSGIVDAGPVDAGPPVSFMNDVAPVLSGACSTCHANRASYADARARVVPRNPAASVLYQKITGTQSSGGPMPPGGQLSIADPAGTALIEGWILQGALNN